MNNNDIFVDEEEWNNILKQLNDKNASIRDMLDKFIEALETLVNEGFVQGERHGNMEIFLDEVKNIRSQLSVMKSMEVTAAIRGLNSSVESTDRY